MNRREFFELLGRISSAAIAAKLLPPQTFNPFSLRASGPHEIDFHRSGISFDPTEFDLKKCYIMKLTFYPEP